MKARFLLAVTLGLLIICTGCKQYFLPEPGIIETEADLMRPCNRLGSITETSDPGKIIQWLEVWKMKRRVKLRADKLGASHMVWEYETNESVAATVYFCNVQKD